MLPRLHPDRLEQAGLAMRPQRRPDGIGIVHLGLGAFQRAHQAVYTEDARALQDGPWGISGVSLRRPDTRDALAPQAGLYTVVERDGSGETLRIIGSLVETLVAPEAPEAVLRRLAQSSVRIVTLTVTEKGYCHDPASGQLNEGDPAVRHDLAQPDRPATVPGFLVAALARRKRAGHAPFTVLSCDNLPSNGATLKRLVRRYAELSEPGLAEWIGSAVAFPNCMVDRIVPATTAQDRAMVAQGLGLDDAWPVIAEPFRHWVVEDDFPAGRPAWDRVGALMVADVAPFEVMKLRLLNGSHSCLAYLGCLAGIETVAEAMQDPVFGEFVDALMAEEIAPTLAVPDGVDLVGYRRALLARFANPALRHRTAQIAMDGSQKLPQRLLGTMRDRLARGLAVDRLALGVAGWLRYGLGKDEHGRPIEVRDPLAVRLAEAAGRFHEADGRAQPARAEALASLGDVFGRDLPHHHGFVAAVGRAFDRLHRHGARAAAAQTLQGE